MRRRMQHILRQLSLPTPWPSGRRATAWSAVLLFIGYVSLLLPRVSGWTGAYLHSEDGQVFLTEYLQRGLGGLFDTYAGYLHVVPRLVVASCDALVSPDAFAGCLTAGSATARLAVAVLAVPVFSAYSRSWRWGLAAALLSILLLPAGQQEVLGNITNLRWFLLAGALLSLMGVFRSWGLIALSSVVAVLAALSEPLVLLLIPVAIWRVVGMRGRSRLPALALLAGAALHVVMIDPSARGERGGAAELLDAPTQLIGQLLVRGPLTTQWGLSLTQDLTRAVGYPVAIATVLLSVVLLVLGWRGRQAEDPAVPFTVLLGLAGFGFLLVSLLFPASYISLADFWSPSQPGRYSALTGIFLTPALVLAASRAWASRRDPRLGPAWVIVMTVVLVIAYVGDARGDARNTDGPTWSETLVSARAECRLTGADPLVPNSPVYEGWQTQLTCEWLGVR